MDERVEKGSKVKMMINEIVDMFQDREFGFDVFVLMKDEKKAIKKFVFYEKNINEKMSFKDKIQNSIVETIKKDYEVDKEEYALIELLMINIKYLCYHKMKNMLHLSV